MNHPSKQTILSGLNAAITDNDDRASIINRAERKAAAVHGGRFDREIVDALAWHFGAEIVPASGGRLAIMVRAVHQGQADSRQIVPRVRDALKACGFDGDRCLG
jgi:hypothetical protein